MATQELRKKRLFLFYTVFTMEKEKTNYSQLRMMILVYQWNLDVMLGIKDFICSDQYTGFVTKHAHMHGSPGFHVLDRSLDSWCLFAPRTTYGETCRLHRTQVKSCRLKREALLCFTAALSILRPLSNWSYYMEDLTIVCGFPCSTTLMIWCTYLSETFDVYWVICFSHVVLFDAYINSLLIGPLVGLLTLLLGVTL